MKIRPIDIKDNRELCSVIRSVLIEMGVPKTGTAYEDEELNAMYEAYLGPRTIYYVITEEKKILGGAGITLLKDGDPSVCELQKMYFLKSARGIGLGKIMIEKCLNNALMFGYEGCYIETMHNMRSAQKLYLSQGFKYIKKPMGNTGHSSCPVWMLKKIQ